MDKYEDRLAQYHKDLAAFESGTDDKLEWDVQSTVADRKAVAAELVSVTPKSFAHSACINLAPQHDTETLCIGPLQFIGKQ